MPVSRMSMGKCTDEPIDCEASRDLRILVNVYVIVKIDEVVPERLTKNQPSDRDQNKTRERCEPQVGALS